MAENKKSFILYADLIHTVNKLSREDRGDLFLTILEYINDLNPIIENNLLLEISFEPIKQQLKRDLKDWEGEKMLRSESGRLGGIKSGESRRKKANEANEASASIASSNEANEAVTVNVTVTDTVNVKKETPAELENPFSIAFLDEWKRWKQYKKEQFRFSYKSITTEQTAINEIHKKVAGNEQLAIDTINHTIGNGWQGFVVPKQIGQLKSPSGMVR